MNPTYTEPYDLHNIDFYKKIDLETVHSLTEI